MQLHLYILSPFLKNIGIFIDFIYLIIELLLYSVFNETNSCDIVGGGQGSVNAR